MLAQPSNKAKIARRVVEVLQFFDEAHPNATVMDIVRRYDRPQSSTSELLSSLVELGILYKDGQNRSYRPTPRAAMLGGSTQAPIIRDGRLTMLLDRLQAQSGLTVALFGLVGVEAQVFNCRSASSRRVGMFCENLTGGQTERLTDSAVGRLLLSTLSRPRREGIVRRLNAEAGRTSIPYGEMLELIDQHERKGLAVGDVGFNIDAEVCAALLPAYAVDQAMAVGLVYRPSANIDVDALTGMLKDAINQAVECEDNHSVTPLVAAA